MTERWIWQRLGAQERPVRVTRWDRRAAHDRHDHDFMELTVITGGGGWHRSPAGELELGAGAVVLVGPGLWHEYHDCHDLAGRDCCFQAGLLHRELAWLVADAQVGALLWGRRRGQRRHGLVSLRLDPATLERVLAHLDRFRQLAELPASASRAEHIGLLTQVLGEVARAAGADEPAAEGGVDPAVAAALRALADGLAEEWTLERLAARTGLAADRLGRLFRAAVGQPPMAYLNRLRAEQAASLLLRSGRPVAEIGAAVGWHDPNYCARRFRESYGCSPRAYRARFAAPPGSC